MTDLLIRNARLVDGAGSEPTDPVEIAIEGATIREVGPRVAVSAEAALDLQGLTVMPGLVDCHVHVIATTANLGLNAALPSSLVAARSSTLMREMLMRGFTTVRDLGGADRGLQHAVEEGHFLAPRLVICGKALSQTGGHTDYRGPYDNRNVAWYAAALGAMGRVCDGLAELAGQGIRDNVVQVAHHAAIFTPSDIPVASAMNELGFNFDDPLPVIFAVAEFSMTNPTQLEEWKDNGLV